MSKGNAGNLPQGVRGNAKPPRDVVMAAYDSLPARLRAAVANAKLDWDTTAIRIHLATGRATEEQVLAQIEGFEARLGVGR